MLETINELLKDGPSHEEFWVSFNKSHEEWVERQKILDAKFATMSENVGGLNRSIGELIETLIAAQLWEKFPEYDLQMAFRRFPLYDEKKQLKAEIDILLVNDESAMAVEVIREADERAVERQIERMARIKNYPPAQLVPGMKLLGAVAGGVITKSAKDYAHKYGLFVLELAGESVIRVPSPAGFTPKEWQSAF